jgi:hypothetical protein
MLHPFEHCFAMLDCLEKGRQIKFNRKKNKWFDLPGDRNYAKIDLKVAELYLNHLTSVVDVLSDRQLGWGHALLTKKMCSIFKPFHSDEKVYQVFIGLKWQQYALEYRFGFTSKLEGDPKQFNDILTQWAVKPQVEFWRRSYKWREYDHTQLTKLASYNKVVKRALKDVRFQNEIFDRVIRGKLPVDLLVEFPNLTTGLEYHMSERIGRSKGAIVQIGRQDGHMVPQIKVDGVWQSIYPLSRVVQIRDDRKTMGELMNVFGDREERMGDYEVFTRTGITPWNDFEYGVRNAAGGFDRIDLPCFQGVDEPIGDSPWWKQLEPIQVLDATEIRELYGVNINPGQWGNVKRASRLTQDLNYLHNHSWTEMLIPVEDQDGDPVVPGQWNVYPFGKYPREYPSGLRNQVTFCVQTHDSIIGYVDENISNLRRQHEGKCEVGDREAGIRTMQTIYEDIALGHNHNMYFQIMGSNCDFWANKIVEVFTGINICSMSHLPLHEGTIGDGFDALFTKLKGNMGVLGPEKTQWVFRRLGAADRQEYNLTKFEPFWDRFLLSSPTKWITNIQQERQSPV